MEKATSIERVAVEKLFWPNPAQGNINLTEGVSNIAIYDLQGSLVKEVAMPAQSVSVEGLNPGIYLIRITLNGNEHNIAWLLNNRIHHVFKNGSFAKFPFFL